MVAIHQQLVDNTGFWEYIAKVFNIGSRIWPYPSCFFFSSNIDNFSAEGTHFSLVMEGVTEVAIK